MKLNYKLDLDPRGCLLKYGDAEIGITTPGYNATYEEAKVYGETYFNGNYLSLVKIKDGFDQKARDSGS